MELLHILLEDAEKNILFRECQNVLVSFLLIVDSETLQHFEEGYEM
jgi:hypothetical protein